MLSVINDAATLEQALSDAVAMCLVKFSLVMLCFIIYDAHALTCRSDGGPKESELKTIYTKCLKMQEGKNSSNRDSGDQDNRRHQRNDWDGQMENDKGRNKNRNERRGMDDRMGSYDDRSSQYDRMGSQSDGMGRQNNRMRSQSDRMGSQSDRMGNRDDRMGGYDDRSDSYDKMGSRDNEWTSGDNRSQEPYGNRYGRDENMNARSDFQHEFGNFSPQFGYQSTQSPHRYKRKSENSGNRSQFNPNSKRYQDSTRGDDNNSGERNSSKDNDRKNCALHCFLENLEMTAEDGMPDQYLVTHALTKDVKNMDLKDFLQESIEECFQILYNENTENKCEFSKNLLMCLSEKGRENCDDWKDDLRF